MSVNKTIQNRFREMLMDWHHLHNHRSMPWKGEPDPYKIWLSEIILQQTRVEQGLNYYLSFIKAYPTVFELAGAKDEDVFKKWEGLGYYSRCHNLLITAREIVNDFGGVFPPDYHQLLSLKGIGPYTAAAIASFGFGLPYAVVDGNVTRVLSRFFNIHLPIDAPEGRLFFKELSSKVLDNQRPGAFNQAIMDFGATICKPILPDCSNCKLQSDCIGYNKGTMVSLPVKGKKKPKELRYFVFLVLENKNEIWINERVNKDVWRHLNEFFLIELPSEKDLINFNAGKMADDLGWKLSFQKGYQDIYNQILTHQVIKTRFFYMGLAERPFLPISGKWVSSILIKDFAFPETINRFLDKNSI